MMSSVRRSATHGFTLTELAVVMTIVAILLASLMYTLSAQTEQRNFEETRHRLEQARDLVLSYAIINGRLPCPARSTSSGAEVRDATTGRCFDGTYEDYYGGTLANGAIGGLLPAVTIGYQQVDPSGFAVDAWGNRVRYAVAKTRESGTCSGGGPFSDPHWVNAAYMKANGVACQPGDLLICKSSTGITGSTCGGSSNQLMTKNLVVAIVFSTGKNGSLTPDAATALATSHVDEAKNLDGVGNSDPVFVWHTPTTTDAANGEFDDQMTWITVGELYGRLIGAGVLP
jgi:prepilin-type N-terminal cleavage/methylation domain-containing protein